jgi:hypothetical protein
VSRAGRKGGAAVAFVTPTHGRPELHDGLYQTFKSQTVEPKKLYVLDTSQEPSPFFTTLGDPDVIYSHRPGAFPRTRDVNRIGAVRNALNEMVQEPIIAHIDDDDWLHPQYGEEMRDRLGDASIAKLDVWRLVTDSDPALVMEWDTRKFGGTHYALQGDTFTRSEGDTDAMPIEVSDMFRDGYGFSMIYPRSTWERHPFPEEGTEDFPFVREVRDSGEKVVFISDLSHLVLHLVSKRSGSGVFPQKILGLLSSVGKMVGLTGVVEEIPRNSKKFAVKKGVTYSVLVSLSTKHTLRSLTTQASKWGVTVMNARDEVDASEFGVNAPPPDYRLVYVTATVDKDTEIPWETPPPLSAFDRTRIIKAWKDGASGLGATPDPNALCSEMMQLGDGSWTQITSGACSDVLSDVQYRAGVQPVVVFAVWTWDAAQGQWTNPTYYYQGSTSATAPSTPAPIPEAATATAPATSSGGSGSSGAGGVVLVFTGLAALAGLGWWWTRRR